MNLPNKLTVLRVLMIPAFVLLFLADTLPHNYLWAFVVFAAAALTDLLDGQIARSRGLVTDFGKLMDPLADKLLVMSAMLCFVPAGIVHVVPVIIILSREFLVTSIRLVAASGGQVIAADIWGKAKTVAQMVWICFALLIQWIAFSFRISGETFANLGMVNYVLVGVVTLLTVFSGFNYVWNNRGLFSDM